MGCDCCSKWSNEANKCTASQKFRDGWCGVNLRNDTKPTPNKKKRKKQPKKQYHKMKK